MPPIHERIVSGFLQRRQLGALTNRSPGKPLRLQFEQLEERNLLSHVAGLAGILDAFEHTSSTTDFVAGNKEQSPPDSQVVVDSLVNIFRFPLVDSPFFPECGGPTVSCADPNSPASPPPPPPPPPPLPPQPPQEEMLLDPTFGTGGIVKTEFSSVAVPYAALSQPDGKVIVAGRIRQFDDEQRSSLALLRYHVDGSLDTSFGDGGVATLTLDDDAFDPYDLVLQADGKILVTGLSWGLSDFVTLRLTADGQLDAGFGVGGVVTTGFEQGPGEKSYDNSLSVAVQPDGKILVGGNAGNVFALVRYHADGSLDTDFGNGGRATGDFGGEHVKAIAVGDDGKIVVLVSGDRVGGLARFNADGTLDTSFGTAGMVADSAATHVLSVGLVLQDDGKIVVAGRNGIVRFHADGSRDANFGRGDKVGTYRFMNGRSLAMDADGNFVIAGTVQSDDRDRFNDFGVAIYNSDGLPVAKTTTDLGTRHDKAYAVAFLPDGSVVVAGGYFTVGSGFALARYQAIEIEDTSTELIDDELEEATPTGGSEEGTGEERAEATSDARDFLALTPDVFDPVTFDATSAQETEPDTPRPDAVQDETVDLALTELTSDDEQDDGTDSLGGGRIETPQISPTDEALMPDPSLLPPVVNLLLGISG